ncbi:hypothetical protein E2C01_074820 [Portunus trituberculatus]|uniref:Uncharacterized protein n=1 Tax=Portunus trituberculatus TaxID=210409 RepID=A0A5B7IE52_PORTR|nr:hypothetical protein [Portunus trituberculatus]
MEEGEKWELQEGSAGLWYKGSGMLVSKCLQIPQVSFRIASKETRSIQQIPLYQLKKDMTTTITTFTTTSTLSVSLACVLAWEGKGGARWDWAGWDWVSATCGGRGVFLHAIYLLCHRLRTSLDPDLKLPCQYLKRRLRQAGTAVTQHGAAAPLIPPHLGRDGQVSEYQVDL